MLKIEDLKVNYGGINAVKGVSFEVPEGSVVSLIGANGAGKSTILRTIAGLVKPVSGKVSFNDEVITGIDTSDIIEEFIYHIYFLMERLKYGVRYNNNMKAFGLHQLVLLYIDWKNQQEPKEEVDSQESKE